MSATRPRIVVLGASSQVGTEVALHLDLRDDVEVLAVARSPLAASLLKRLGIAFAVADLDATAADRALLAEADVVVDFATFASDRVAPLDAFYRQRIERMLAATAPGCRIVFISTIDAFGMSPEHNHARHYRLPRSVYALTKRRAERRLAAAAARAGREAFSLRLGHVHGHLQAVSAETRRLVNGPHRRFRYPTTPSYTVFCFSIAEALVRVAQGRVTPGTYTLVSTPMWSWAEVLRFHAEPGRAIAVEAAAGSSSGPGARVIAAVRAGVARLAARQRDTAAVALAHFPALLARIKAAERSARARREIAAVDGAHLPHGIHIGAIPGPFVPELGDSRETMADAHARARARIDLARVVVPW